jgi:hypothetical protein
VPESVSIPSRFNGPLENGNGGYCAGIAAGFLSGPVEASLRRPVPLDTPLEVEREGDRAVRLLDDGKVVVEARAPVEPDVDPPEPVGVEEAREAARRYRGPTDGLFSKCFVCGRTRQDAFGVFAGEVEGRNLVASPWTPPAWTAGDDGNVRPEFVWSVLDCPTYFAVYLGKELPVSFLARLTARLSGPVRAGEEHVVMAWPLGADGRKQLAGSAVLSAGGDPLAAASALMIEPRG